MRRPLRIGDASDGPWRDSCRGFTAASSVGTIAPDGVCGLRRFAISLSNATPQTTASKKKSELAGGSNELLMEILTAQGV